MKKILALLLCLLMVFSLAACGDKKEPEESNPSQNIIKPEDDITEPEETEPEETEPEETEPVVEEITTFDKFCVDNKLFALSDLTESTMIKNGFKPKGGVSSWMVFSDFMSLSGVGYKYGSNDMFVSFNEEGQVNGIIVSSADSTIKFFGDFKVGMTEDEAKALFRSYSIDSNKDTDGIQYAVHNDDHSLVYTVNDGIVSEIVICVSKDANLNISEAEKMNQMDSDYFYQYETMAHSSWPGFSDEINYKGDMTRLVIDGRIFNFNDLTLDNLKEFSYKPNGEIKATMDESGNVAIVARKLDNAGAQIYVVSSPTGKIEYLKVDIVDPNSSAYEEGDRQVDCSFFAGLTLGHNMDEAKLLWKIKDDVSTTQTIVRGSVNTAIIEYKDGVVSSITLINNKLAGYQ